MSKFNRTIAVAAVAAVALGITVATPAVALIGGSIDANSTSSPWAGVVSITPIGGGVYSGALIDRSYVLTAAHVAAGFVNNPGSLTININYGGDKTQLISASQIFVHPDYTTGNLQNDTTFAWNDDIALIRLAEPAVAGVPVYTLFNGVPGSNGAPIDVKMVAYGAYGDGISATLTGSSATVKRIGANRLESLYPADDEGVGAPVNVAEGFVFNLDAPGSQHYLAGEVGYAGGDSGSPVFINDHGTWRIVGVGAFNGATSNAANASLLYGAIGGGMLIAPYTNWIQSQMTAAVPEPRTYALMLAGIVLIAAAARARRSFARSLR